MKNSCLQRGLLSIFIILNSTALLACSNLGSVPKNFVSLQSSKVEAKIDSVIKERFEELVTKLPKGKNQSFAHGEIFIKEGNLVWRDKAGLETHLVTKENYPSEHTLSGFMVSPDQLKVAFYSTFQGQDLKHWNVAKIAKSPKLFLKDPVLNRMQGFSWGKNSNVLYYSFWYPKDQVKKGEKPILSIHSRNLRTKQDQVVFDHKLAENFEIADLDGGKNLVAYRLLNRAAGIKTTFSMYHGVKKGTGYEWKSIYPRNKHVAVYLGLYDSRPVILTSGEGDRYGISEIDVLNGAKVRSVVSGRANSVLHSAEITGDYLVLQYHSIPEQDVSVVIKNMRTQKSKVFSMKELELTAYGNLTRFIFSPGSKTARATFSDVMSGKHVLELDLEKQTLKKLQNIKNINFDASKITASPFSFMTQDGTKISGRVYRVKGNQTPSFVFFRYYGWISIKNSPEPREVQMALELGGAYVTLDLPGGGERGENWFIKGSRNRLQMIQYISEASSFFQNRMGLGPEKMVAMGRSWGGLTSLVLAANHGDNFGVINPVVPVLDLIDVFENGWFGRIAHSDLAPSIDAYGDYILDSNFYNYVQSINPKALISKINKSSKIHLFTNGLDDRVDQGGDLESSFAHQIACQIGSDNFKYHRSIKGNHGNRFYQVLMFSLIKDHYGLKYNPLKK